MRITYGIETESEPEVRAWFDRLNHKLLTGTGKTLTGKVERVGNGLYVIDVHLVGGLFPYTIGSIMLGVSAVVAAMFGRLEVASGLAFFSALLFATVCTLLTPATHYCVMYVSLYRLMERRVRIRLATHKILQRFVDGKT